MAKKRYEHTVLAADVGGTNANFGIVGLTKNGKPEIIIMQRYSTTSAKKFSTIVNRFLEFAKEEHYLTPKYACLAGAGPVYSVKGSSRIHFTNANQTMDEKDLLKNTPLTYVLIMNDFEALSYVVNVLDKKDYITINKGKPIGKATKGVTGAGTGLGASILHYEKSACAYLPIATEGGHCDVHLFSEEDMKLMVFVRKKKKFKWQVSYEEMLAGMGIEITYKYLQTTKYPLAPKNLKANEVSKRRKQDLCSRETFDIWLNLYARYLRNFAFSSYCRGGLYIAGGIAGKNSDLFGKKFIEEFVKNNRYPDIVKATPVYLITNYDVSILGAAFALFIEKFK